MSEEIKTITDQSMTIIEARKAALRRLGPWSTTRGYRVDAARSRLVLDLREPCDRFTDVTVDVTLEHSTLILLVGDNTAARDEVRWTGRGSVKDRWTDKTTSTMRLTGTAHDSEIRIHRGGAAAWDDLSSMTRLRELQKSEGDTETDHVPVLIVGGGYAGTAAALFLAQNGIRALMVDRHDGVSVQGRARGVNQRTMELYRPLGLGQHVRDLSAPFAADAGVARCESLSQPWEWLFDPEPDPRLETISPDGFVMADQNTVEPVLTGRAIELGARIERGTIAEDIAVGEGGVTATLRSAATGAVRRVRSDYLIGADGYQSRVRDVLGIHQDGPEQIQDWVSIVFDADLEDLVPRRALFWIVLNEQLGFAALTTTAQPGRWSLGVAYDPDITPLTSFDTDKCTDLVRTALGGPSRAVEIIDVTPWQQAIGVAGKYRHGRAFLVGDAAHVWPPAGAMGANSGIQDAHNLAWKLAAILDGRADEALLDSYEDERRPVAQALAGLTARRQAARFGGAVEDDVDDIVCTFGQRYHSGAIVGDTALVPFSDTVASVAEAGARVPHRWLDAARRTSIHDLAGTSFVLAAAHPAAWQEALRPYGVTVQQAPSDLLPPDTSAALIRPDGYVAWLADGDATGDTVRDVLHRVLGRTPGTTK